MFCPQCGRELPNDARFCASCGAQITPQAPQPEPTAPNAGPAGFNPYAGAANPHPAASASGQQSPIGQRFSAATTFSSFRIATIVLAIVALVCTFFPWFETSDQLAYLGQIGSGLSDFYRQLGGGGASMAAFAESYAPWQFGLLGFDILGYAGDNGGAPLYMIMLVITMLAWLVGFALTIIGLIRYITGNTDKAGLLFTGLIILAIISLLWAFVFNTICTSNKIAQGFPIFALFTGAAAIGGCIVYKYSS